MVKTEYTSKEFVQYLRDYLNLYSYYAMTKYFKDKHNISIRAIQFSYYDKGQRKMSRATAQHVFDIFGLHISDVVIYKGRTKV